MLSIPALREWANAGTEYLGVCWEDWLLHLGPLVDYGEAGVHLIPGRSAAPVEIPDPADIKQDDEEDEDDGWWN